MEEPKALNVAIVGGGPGAKAVTDMILSERLSQLQMKLIGVACTNSEAVGFRYAQENGIYATNDYRDLYDLKDLNIIIELTGREEVASEIRRTKPDHIRVIDHVVASLFWDLFDIEEQKIAECKRADEELRQSEERYRRITSAVTDYIFSVRIENGRPVETVHGPACVGVTGYASEEFADNPYLWIQMVHEHDRRTVEEQASSVLSGQETQAIGHRILRKNGTTCWVRNTLVPHYDTHGKLLSYDGLIRDISEQKRLEAQLQQAKKMEAIGTLAGGVAHDFNNLLMVMQGNVSLMLCDIDPTHPHCQSLKDIEKKIRSGAKLTAQLLGYARKGKYEVMPINLNRLVEETSEAFGRTKKEITIHPDLARDLYAIEADRGQIEQVLYNLYINAENAMPGGGKIVLKSMNVTHEVMKRKLYDPKPGKYVLLTVTDTGIGMDKDTQSRIFEPFFTTREMGRGTGLGLASVYGIIKGHGGYIDVESEKGRGTTFYVFLPVSEKEIQETDKTAKQTIKANGTILLVDDEEMVLNIGVQALKRLGFTVLQADGGKEAVEVYEKNKDRIDMVILDMIMPEMGGGETYDRMKEINADVKVLLSSGYSIHGQATEILERGCNGFIQKPFGMQELSEKIIEILEK